VKAPARFRPLGTVGVAALFACIALAGCNPARKAYLERLSALEKGPSGAASSQSIDELKKGIARYSAEVERQVKAAQNLGVYYKMLALKYLDASMYKLALENLDKAVEIFPENPQLAYYSAVASARMAKAELTDEAAAAEDLRRAEIFYRRAIFLEPGNVNALYGLAVLYAMELGRPADAEPLLKAIVAKEKKNVEALFLLARIRYSAGRPEEAIEIYKRIADTTQASRLKAQALANKSAIEEELYGQK
jgi:cytochrome c-type biogenesis protein CcmH/NrfG